MVLVVLLKRKINIKISQSQTNVNMKSNTVFARFYFEVISDICEYQIHRVYGTD